MRTAVEVFDLDILQGPFSLSALKGRIDPRNLNQGIWYQGQDLKSVPSAMT
jgi:hypothetical protein